MDFDPSTAQPEGEFDPATAVPETTQLTQGAPTAKPTGISGRTIMQVGMPQLGGAYAPELFQGVLSPMLALYQMGAQALGSSSNPDAALSRYNKSAFGDVPLSDTAKGIGSVLPLSLGMQFLPAATGIVGNTALGAGAGAGAAALTPIESPDDNFWKQKLSQIKSGALWGGGTAGVLGAISKAFAPTPAATALRQEKVTPTIGQSAGGGWKALEEKATSIPILGDAIKKGQRAGIEEMNRAMYVRAVEPFGDEGIAAVSKAKVGNEGVAAVGDFLSSKYHGALDASVPASLRDQAGQLFQQDITTLAKTVPTAKQSDFVSLIKRTIVGKATAAGTITPSVAKAADSELGRVANSYRGSPIGDEREYAAVVREAQSALRQFFANANPETAATIRAADQGWATLTQIERAASSLGAKEGVFSPPQLLSAIKRGDASIRDRAFARGTALNQDFAQAADRVLSKTYPDSGTVGRGIIAALAGGGVGYLSPWTLAGVGAAAVPYLPYARNVAASTQGLLGSAAPALPYLGMLGGSLAAAGR